MEFFDVSPSCWNAGLHSRAILFRGVSIRPSPPGFPEQVRRIAADLRARFPTPRSVRESAPMVELHSIFRTAGVNPRKLQPACERLVQLVLKRGAIPTINNLVDAYNLVSLKWSCSLGAHDLDRLAPPVRLRFLNGDETFVPLGSRDPEPFGRGEFGYVDARNRLICRLDVRQAEFSKITPGTTNVLLIVGATRAIGSSDVERILAETVDEITGTCGGSGQILAG